MVRFDPGCGPSFFMAGLLLTIISPVQGGNCWVGMSRPGRCTSLLSQHVDKETCCSDAKGGSSPAGAAWSPEDLDAGGLFFWRVLGGGVPCTPCKDSCAGVKCGEGKQCTMRKGRPKCVCAPDCRNLAKPASSAVPIAAVRKSGKGGNGGNGGKGGKGGPVCGTDGKSYRSACRLLKRACRRGNSSLQVDYHGLCQTSCASVRCDVGHLCVLDQNVTPHCVRCPLDTEKHCGTSAAPGRAVCGTDGRTYASSCHLRAAACRLGRAIPVAYRGRCSEGAACGKIRCGRRQSCLTVPATGAARCVSCNFRCGGKHRDSLHLHDDALGLPGPLCASNNRTYRSWCHMIRDSCATGFILETKHDGACRLKGDDKKGSIPSSGDNIVGVSLLSPIDLNKKSDFVSNLRSRKAGRDIAKLGVINVSPKRATDMEDP